MPYKDPNDPRRKASKAKYKASAKGRAAAHDYRIKYYWNPIRIEQLRRRARETRQAENDARATHSRPDCCEACGDFCGKTGKNGIVLDHCHKTGIFRGWLCPHCNHVLGKVRDDPRRLLKLAAYLTRTRTSQTAQLTFPGV